MSGPVQNESRSDQSQPLLSKLSPPVLPRYLVPRNQIAERVRAALNAKVILVRAPAGFGKTTVMLQLRERFDQDGAACTWLNLDDADNDASRFLSCLRSALRPVLGADVDIAGEGRRSETSELALILLDRVAQHPEPFVLMIDEFEALHSPVVLALISKLIDRLPLGAQLVIGSRSLPEIGLARLRARGQLLEIDPAQLRFSATETDEFLVQRRGLTLRSEHVERLHRSTEGWVAALWLASIALERHPNTDEFIDGFSGSNADIADYLAEDVLGRQTPLVREFLLKTSILEQLTPQLCDAVCTRNDSLEQLLRIERANLFLIPLDENHSVYRYHSVFAGFLSEQLKRSHPDWIPDLHRAASKWYLEQDRPVPAITHALRSSDLAYALPLLERHAGYLLGGGRLRLLNRWLDPLPPAALDEFPTLRLIHAWAVNFTRGPCEALTLIENLDAENLTHPDAVAQLLALRPMLLGMTDCIEESYALAQRNLKLVEPRFGFAFGMLAQTLANTSMILGKFTDARDYADQARTAQQGNESSFQFTLAEAVEGAIDLMQGRLRQATVRLRAVSGATSDDLTSKYRRNAFPAVLLAESLYEAGEIKQAERLLSVFAPLLRELGLPDHLITAHVLLARILWDRGEIEEALKVLEELESVGHRLAFRRVIACARLERARGFVGQGLFDAAKEQLDRSGDAAYWQEVSARSYVANDVLTHAIGYARWSIRSGAAADVIPTLKQQLEDARQQNRLRRWLKLSVLMAEALYQDGQRKSAMRMLERSLQFAASEGFISTFLEEGGSIHPLLTEYAETRSDAADAGNAIATLVARIVSSGAQKGMVSGDAHGSLAEPLTRKEIKVLELLAQGYSNSALAEKLFVSESTVRTHLRNINIKLKASNRTQSIVIARKLQLIA